MSNQQPTILIKKADGTSVRVTLEEFKQIKSGQTDNVSSATSATLSEHTSNDLPMVTPEPGLPATTTPVTDVFVNEAASRVALAAYDEVATDDQTNEVDTAQTWSSADHQSPLEEELQPTELRTESVLPTPPTQLDIVDQVLTNLTYQVAEEVLGRTKALIQSRLKDIRNDEQVVRYATQPMTDGGLGLTQDQAGELVSVLHTMLGLGSDTTPYVPVQQEVIQKKKSLPDDPERKETQSVNMTKPLETARPSSLDELIRSQAADVNMLPSLSSTSAVPSPDLSTVVGISSHKPILRDVTPPTAETLGPVDELARFTLTDLRRLGGTRDQQKMVILNKFETLKQDSFVLFMQGIAAWYRNPLYRHYQSVIARSVNSRRSIDEVLGGWEGEHLTKDEFDLLIEIGEQIRV